MAVSVVCTYDCCISNYAHIVHYIECSGSTSVYQYYIVGRRCLHSIGRNYENFITQISYRYKNFLFSIQQVYLILIKTICYHFHQNEIQQIGRQLTEQFNGLNAHKNTFALEKQRFYFMQEATLFFISHFNALVLLSAICFEVRIL